MALFERLFAFAKAESRNARKAALLCASPALRDKIKLRTSKPVFYIVSFDTISDNCIRAISIAELRDVVAY